MHTETILTVRSKISLSVQERGGKQLGQLLGTSVPGANNVEEKLASLATRGRRVCAGEQELDTKSFAISAHKQ